MEQPEVLEFALRVLEAQQVAYMVVGSVASMAYGEPRMTRDIDIVVDLRPHQVPTFIAEFARNPDFYLSPPAITSAVEKGTMFNIIHATSGNKLDFMPSRRDAWGKERFARRRRIPLTGKVVGYVASPEDIVLGKLWYHSLGDSEKHLRDIAGMLPVSGDKIDRSYIERWVSDLGYQQSWEAAQALEQSGDQSAD